MTFNSYSFIFIFLPVVLLGVWGIQNFSIDKNGKDKLMKLWLIVMSAFFFVGYGTFSIVIFLSSIVCNLIFSFVISTVQKNKAGGNASGIRYVKALAIVGNILLLAGFKYLGTGVMPIAISFYTFSQIMFIAELGVSVNDDFDVLGYLSYILFFPKILQGPIADYKSISGELKGLADKKMNFENLASGLMLFSLGLFKKVLLADILGKAVDFAYGGVAAMTALDAILVAFSYSFQLYFDFSGYCDMAEGVCGMMGMELVRNFDAPYTAENISEFWDRWHISLTRYLYIPLGGSRKGTLRTYINILIVFFVSGLWHGNGWNFVIWGLMHGVLMVLTRLCAGAVKGTKSQSSFEADKKGLLQNVKKVVNIFLTFSYVTAAWVFFRAPSARDALTLLGKIVNPDAWRGFHISIKFAECFMMDELWYMFKVTPIPGWSKSNYICMWIILIFSAVMIFSGRTARKIADKHAAFIFERNEKSGSRLWALSAFYGILFVWGVLSLGGVSTFLYVNF